MASSDSWNDYEITVGGQAEAALIFELALRRLAERSSMVPATRPNEFVLQGDRGTLYCYMHEEASVVKLKELRGPKESCVLAAEPNGDGLVFRSDDGDREHWRALVEMLETLPHALPKRVPYGLIANGEVVGILYTAQEAVGKDDDGDGEAFHCWLYVNYYVAAGLQGNPFVPWMEIAATSITQYWLTVSAAIADGLLIPLGPRLCEPTGTSAVWAEAGIYTIIPGGDQLTPRLAECYLSWAPDEPFPGANVAAARMALPTYEDMAGRPLTSWFRQ